MIFLLPKKNSELLTPYQGGGSTLLVKTIRIFNCQRPLFNIPITTKIQQLPIDYNHFFQYIFNYPTKWQIKMLNYDSQRTFDKKVYV